MKKIIIPVLGLLAAIPASADKPAKLTEDTLLSVSDMQSLKKKVADKIRDYRSQKYTCSQATFLGICKTLGCELTEEQLMAVSAGFAGGIGRTFNEGTCGALTVGTVALGMYLKGENEKSIALSKELFDHFMQQEGTVICGNITQKHGFSRCTGCCVCIGEKVTEILQREKMPDSAQSVISWDKATIRFSNS